MDLLKALCEIPGTSGDERVVSEFILQYIATRKGEWDFTPEVFCGDSLQDCIVIKVGNPRTAIFAHMDTVGFTVRYFDQLIPVGSPEAPAGTVLVGRDQLGPIECTLEIDKDHRASYRFGRVIERGTALTYKVNFRSRGKYITSACLDDRLGIYAALRIAEKMKNGIVAFSCWEEHGGGTVPMLARFIFERWSVKQALISDVTWASDGIQPGKGVVVSLRDRNIPRRSYVDRILSIARHYKVPCQMEVEGAGSSDGRELQLSPYPFDWCFVGPPQEHSHTPNERVHKQDIDSMLKLYGHLMDEL